MDTDTQVICRVVTYTTATHTYYHAERLVYKSRWFSKSGYEWEKFCILKDKYTGESSFNKLYPYDYTAEVFKDNSVAEYYCQQWVAHKTPKVVKEYAL